MKFRILQIQSNVKILTQKRPPREEEELWTNTTKILYGPVASRRLGESLGINLFPEGKGCSLNCIYCDVGYNPSKFKILRFDELKKLFDNEFKVYLELYKSGKIQIDYLTFCGNGEDTLHPDFVRFCKYVMEIRKHYLPHIPLAILTGGGLIWEKKCLECLNQIDVKFVKLDVGNPEMFTRRKCGKNF